jgi:hypothetical protein
MDSRRENSFSSLPVDVQICIFCFLGHDDLLVHVANVSRRCHGVATMKRLSLDLSSRAALWRRRNIRLFV